MDFKHYAKELQRLNGEVKEEIRLAAYQAAERDRRLQVFERQATSRHRILGRLIHEKLDTLSREDRDWKLKAQGRKSSKLAYIRTTSNFD